MKGARAIASPGCYPTSVLLAITPLLAAGVVDPAGIVADCMSGVSGAGRSVKADLTFGKCEHFLTGPVRFARELIVAFKTRSRMMDQMIVMSGDNEGFHRFIQPSGRV